MHKFQDVWPAFKSIELFRRFLIKVVLYFTWPVLCFAAGLYRRWWVNRCTLVAITGSFGKTTTAYVLSEVLNRRDRSQFDTNTRPRVALAILRLKRRDRIAILEVGIAKPGQMDAFAWMIRPDIVVVTSIGTEHLGTKGSLDRVKAEKAKLVRSVDPEGFVIVNGDDPNVLGIRRTGEGKSISVGFGENNELRASIKEFHYPPAMTVQVVADHTSYLVRSSLVGRVMVYPLLFAVAIAKLVQVQTVQVLKRFEQIQPYSRRMEVVRLPGRAWAVVDDRKSLHETVSAALATVGGIPAKRRIVVLGEVGNLDPNSQDGVHGLRRLGRQLGSIAERVFLTCNNPSQVNLLEGGLVESGFEPARIYKAKGDLKTVREELEVLLNEGDLVLFKGRFFERLNRI